MKIKIKTHNGELPSYLTVGKVYEVETWEDDFDGGWIVPDSGEKAFVDINFSQHLNGGSWEVVSE